MSVVDDIKARLDIVETVSGYVALQKSGRHWKAPCPFHTEKTPSFIVNPERQSWHCFGACATGGDVLSFVMRSEGLDFGGTLRLLSQKAGVDLTPKAGRDRDRHEELYRVNQVAARFYRDVLRSSGGRTGMRYLEERGVDAASIDRFELGLSPNGWDGLKSHLAALGIDENRAVESGLVHRREDGNSWDFFRGRLMFPIHDRRGRVTGFGARALDDSTPKYINTAATPIFDKRGTLYGLHLAAEAIRAKSAGIVVEGYMDVLAAHQHGHTNVVASMGTALTGQQVSRLKSMATKFILALDPDAAGQEATLRSLESSWRVFEGQAVDDRRRSVGVLYKREPLTLKIAALPQGRDPDKLIREDLNQWERLIEDAVPAQEFYISSVVSKFDRSTAQGKAQAVEVLRPVVVSTDPVEQDHYLNMVADAVKVDKEAVKASIGRPRRAPATASRRRAHYDGPGRQEIVAPPLSSGAESSLEDHTLALLLSRPELRTHAAEFAPEHFHGSEAREVFTRWMASSTIDDLRDSLDESLHDHLTFLTQKELVATQQIEDEAALGECLQRLKSRHLKGLQEALLASEDAGVPPPREMERQIVNLNAQLKETFAQRPQ